MSERRADERVGFIVRSASDCDKYSNMCCNNDHEAYNRISCLSVKCGFKSSWGCTCSAPSPICLLILYLEYSAIFLSSLAWVSKPEVPLQLMPNMLACRIPGNSNRMTSLKSSRKKAKEDFQLRCDQIRLEHEDRNFKASILIGGRFQRGFVKFEEDFSLYRWLTLLKSRQGDLKSTPGFMNIKSVRTPVNGTSMK